MENWKETINNLLHTFNKEGYWSCSVDQEEPIVLSDKALATSLSFFENLPDNYPHPKIAVSNDYDEEGSYLTCVWENEDQYLILIITETKLSGLLKDMGGHYLWRNDKGISYSGGEIPQEILSVIPLKTKWKPTIFDQLNA